MAGIDLTKIFAQEALLRFEPSVVGYSRLEPMSLTQGDLAPGLQMLLGDPLWLVGRQWQFEELRGEDAGSPVKVEVRAEHGPVTRIHPGSFAPGDAAAASVDLSEGGTPIEVAVEAEAPDRLPERVRAQTGMQLLRVVRGSTLPQDVRRALVAAILDAFPFRGAVDAEVDPEGSARRRLLTGRVPDGAAVAADLVPRLAANGNLRSLPAPLRTAAGARTADVRRVLGGWATWARDFVASPVGDSWDPHRLEYSFALQAGLSGGDVTLSAAEYAGGTLDWYHYEASDGPDLGAPAAPAAPAASPVEMLPVPVRYPGMPSDRLWAFEDARVYLGGLEAGTTDLARLALVEFSLVFGDDWFQVPLDLPAGHLARVSELTCFDSFGTALRIRPSRDPGRNGWSVFAQTGAEHGGRLADTFFVPATVRHALEGPPLEEVALFRDEMANLVWGVERIVQGPTGEPVRRGLVESRSLRQSLPGDLGDAAIVYRLMTPVPDHWIPFVSVPVPGRSATSFATELERRPMVRFLDDGTVEVAHPHGALLREDPTGDVAGDRLRIAEEEVPRDGIVVNRRFQLARTPDGRTVLWVGRRKEPGRGEGSSGLKYDTALPPAAL
jgi:hypothetical protein